MAGSGVRNQTCGRKISRANIIIFLLLLTGAQLLHFFRLSSANLWETQRNLKTSTFGLVVVHCSRDPEITWLDDVPRDWKLTVYETCGKKISRGSVPLEDKGGQECDGYFQYIIDNYDDLPDINVFLQDDSIMLPYKDRPRQAGLWHTPFRTIAALENATFPHLNQSHGFLHYGMTYWRRIKVAYDDPYMRGGVKEMWDEMNLPYTNDTVYLTRPKASFAVHRDRILANGPELYKSLQKKLYSKTRGVGRRKCCALEHSWHVLFGEPAVLPQTSTLDLYLQEIGFKYGDLIGR